MKIKIISTMIIMGLFAQGISVDTNAYGLSAESFTDPFSESSEKFNVLKACLLAEIVDLLKHSKKPDLTKILRPAQVLYVPGGSKRVQLLSVRGDEEKYEILCSVNGEQIRVIVDIGDPDNIKIKEKNKNKTENLTSGDVRTAGYQLLPGVLDSEIEKASIALMKSKHNSNGNGNTENIKILKEYLNTDKVLRDLHDIRQKIEQISRGEKLIDDKGEVVSDPNVIARYAKILSAIGHVCYLEKDDPRRNIRELARERSSFYYELAYLMNKGDFDYFYDWMQALSKMGYKKEKIKNKEAVIEKCKRYSKKGKLNRYQETKINVLVASNLLDLAEKEINILESEIGLLGKSSGIKRYYDTYSKLKEITSIIKNTDDPRSLSVAGAAIVYKLRLYKLTDTYRNSEKHKKSGEDMVEIELYRVLDDLYKCVKFLADAVDQSNGEGQRRHAERMFDARISYICDVLDHYLEDFEIAGFFEDQRKIEQLIYIYNVIFVEGKASLKGHHYERLDNTLSDKIDENLEGIIEHDVEAKLPEYLISSIRKYFKNYEYNINGNNQDEELAETVNDLRDFLNSLISYNNLSKKRIISFKNIKNVINTISDKRFLSVSSEKIINDVILELEEDILTDDLDLVILTVINKMTCEEITYQKVILEINKLLANNRTSAYKNEFIRERIYFMGDFLGVEIIDSKKGFLEELKLEDSIKLQLDGYSHKTRIEEIARDEKYQNRQYLLRKIMMDYIDNIIVPSEMANIIDCCEKVLKTDISWRNRQRALALLMMILSRMEMDIKENEVAKKDRIKKEISKYAKKSEEYNWFSTTNMGDRGNLSSKQKESLLKTAKRCLSDEEDAVRTRAIKIFRVLKDALIIGKLKKVLREDRSWDIIKSAAKTIASINPKNSSDFLNSENDFVTRFESVSMSYLEIRSWKQCGSLDEDNFDNIKNKMEELREKINDYAVAIDGLGNVTLVARIEFTYKYLIIDTILKQMEKDIRSIGGDISEYILNAADKFEQGKIHIETECKNAKLEYKLLKSLDNMAQDSIEEMEELSSMHRVKALNSEDSADYGFETFQALDSRINGFLNMLEESMLYLIDYQTPLRESISFITQLEEVREFFDQDEEFREYVDKEKELLGNLKDNLFEGVEYDTLGFDVKDRHTSIPKKTEAVEKLVEILIKPEIMVDGYISEEKRYKVSGEKDDIKGNIKEALKKDLNAIMAERGIIAWLDCIDKHFPADIRDGIEKYFSKKIKLLYDIEIAKLSHKDLVGKLKKHKNSTKITEVHSSIEENIQQLIKIEEDVEGICLLKDHDGIFDLQRFNSIGEKLSGIAERNNLINEKIHRSIIDVNRLVKNDINKEIAKLLKFMKYYLGGWVDQRSFNGDKEKLEELYALASPIDKIDEIVQILGRLSFQHPMHFVSAGLRAPDQLFSKDLIKITKGEHFLSPGRVFLNADSFLFNEEHDGSNESANEGQRVKSKDSPGDIITCEESSSIERVTIRISSVRVSEIRKGDEKRIYEADDDRIRLAKSLDEFRTASVGYPGLLELVDKVELAEREINKKLLAGGKTRAKILEAIEIMVYDKKAVGEIAELRELQISGVWGESIKCGLFPQMDKNGFIKDFLLNIISNSPGCDDVLTFTLDGIDGPFFRRFSDLNPDQEYVPMIVQYGTNLEAIRHSYNILKFSENRKYPVGGEAAQCSIEVIREIMTYYSEILKNEEYCSKEISTDMVVRGLFNNGKEEQLDLLPVYYIKKFTAKLKEKHEKLKDKHVELGKKRAEIEKKRDELGEKAYSVESKYCESKMYFVSESLAHIKRILDEAEKSFNALEDKSVFFFKTYLEFFRKHMMPLIERVDDLDESTLELLPAEWLKEIDEEILNDIGKKKASFVQKKRRIIISRGLIPDVQKGMISEINKKSKDAVRDGRTSDSIEIRNFSYIQNIKPEDNTDVVIIFERKEAAIYDGELTHLSFEREENEPILINGLVIAGRAVLYEEFGKLREIFMLLSGRMNVELPDIKELGRCIKEDKKEFARILTIVLAEIIPGIVSIDTINRSIMAAMQFA